ncbi:MAG TPA: cyclic nucleotide-binding domain-containing protein [Thermoanaerobaculia bacterium]|nr:cyclic nucleotide-binding domain-containing protein [Thermoanaerobaculia bacterium]
MAIKWFGGGKKPLELQEHSIDDLIVLERYEEAGERLRSRLKESPNDLHSHLKLAEVYTELRQLEKAVDEYGFVAEEYAQDGFYDKGIALLSKAMKLAPADASLRAKVEKLQRDKDMEHVRTLALEGLRQAGGVDEGTSMLELRRLWGYLAAGSVVQHLPGEQLKRLFSNMELVRLDARAELAREGSPEAFLLLIITGVVDAAMAERGRSILVRSFTSGDVLGEAVSLERGTWPADYRVTEPLVALKLTRAGLEQALLGNPDPRGFLETLREQHNDRDVAATVRRLRGGS